MYRLHFKHWVQVGKLRTPTLGEVDGVLCIVPTLDEVDMPLSSAADCGLDITIFMFVFVATFLFTRISSTWSVSWLLRARNRFANHSHKENGNRYEM